MTSGLIRSNLLRENKAMSLPLLSLNAAAGVSSSTLRLGDASKHRGTLATARRSDGYPRSSSPRGTRKTTMTRLNAAGFAEVEPDLNEDPVDRWETPSIDSEDFLYGIYDGHHTYHEGEDKGNFWEILQEEYASAEPPTGFQGVISWLFLPTVALAMYLDVPGEYLYIGAALYTAVFCIIEMNKPDKPHNFEPQIYNMERGARDKLIADYNSMDIWDFNEKYGDLWDFTVKKDDITRR